MSIKTGIIKTAGPAALLTAADQLTKYLAVAFLKKRGSVTLINGVLELYYLENRGAAFGILQNRQWVFIVFGLVMAAACFYFILRTYNNAHMRPVRICLIFLMSGALGNLIDRIFRGYVVDFIYFSIINFPVFNVADIYVSCSVTVLVILTLFFYRE